MSRPATIAPPEVCLRIYYGASSGTVGNKEIRELFQYDIGSARVCRIKKEVKRIMAERNVWTYRPENVNVDILFEFLGLDIKKLERNRRKLAEMGAAQSTSGVN